MYRIMYRNRIWEDWIVEYFNDYDHAKGRKRELHYLDVPGKDRPNGTYAIVQMQRKHILYEREQWI